MSPRYDVFLSHASADKPEVEKLAHKLRAVGIKPFLDKWNLRPGRFWQTELAKGLRDSGACAIFFGSEEFGPWHQQEMLVALDRGARDSEFPVIPVLLPGFRRPERIPEFLAQRTWVEFSSLEDEDAFRRLVWGIQEESPELEKIPENPPRPPSYRSMAPIPEQGFIHRRQYDLILEALCLKGEATPSSTSIGITTALRGAGGFGKTALAQMLCQDERVQEIYPGGILWATMGDDIDANGRLNRILDLIRWWTQKELCGRDSIPGDWEWLRPPHYRIVSAGSAGVKGRLRRPLRGFALDPCRTRLSALGIESKAGECGTDPT